MKQITILLSVFMLIACSETNNSDSTTANQSNEVVQNDVVESTEEVVNNSIEEVAELQEEAEAEIEEGTETATNELLKEEEIVKPELKEDDNVLHEEVGPKQEVVTETIPQGTNVPLKPNHEKWNALLKKNVSSSGKVNYSGMKSGLAELEAYVTYLESFATQDGWTRNEKLAYWINLYNAATVRLIAQNYPVSSITDLSGGKPWDQNIVKVGTKNYSLNDIENGIIRPKFNDARIHFAVNCAAKSCPKLMNSAFTAEKLNRQLTKQTSAFINSSENNITADMVEISKIFDWYKGDFEKGDLVKFLNKYTTTPVNESAEIKFKEYDWALNK